MIGHTCCKLGPCQERQSLDLWYRMPQPSPSCYSIDPGSQGNSWLCPWYPADADLTTCSSDLKNFCIYFKFFFFFGPHSMRDLISLTRDWTHMPLQQKGRFSTTGPPGKSHLDLLLTSILDYLPGPSLTENLLSVLLWGHTTWEWERSVVAKMGTSWISLAHWLCPQSRLAGWSDLALPTSLLSGSEVGLRDLGS